MKFRTELSISPFPVSINHHHTVGFLGSCFSENMGTRLEDNKVYTFVNPYGTVFTPLALLRIVKDALQNHAPRNTHFVVSENWHYSFDYPSAVSASSHEELAKHIEEKNAALRKQLKKADVLFITLGTAWVYYHKEFESYVANCHKVPQKAFEKRLSPHQELGTQLQELQGLLKAFNPKLQIVYTVSPVKHVKDGIVANNRSKALLLSAVHEVVDSSDALYFPSYELVTEDLRDYRYYKKDLVHPNELAIDYIWEHFEKAFFLEDTMKLNHRIQKVRAAASHRFQQAGKNQIAFALKQLEHIKDLEHQLGLGRFIQEKKWFESLCV